MRRRFVVPVAIAVVALCGVAASPVHSQPLPAATGRVIEASDGDVVVVPRDGHVTLVRRSHVQARLVYIAARQTLLLLTDPAIAFGQNMPDAKGFFRWQVKQPWPLEPRWEGSASIDEYSPFGRGALGMAIHTDRGTIYVGPEQAPMPTLTPAPVASVRSFPSTSRAVRGSFDEIEQTFLTQGEHALSGRGPQGATRIRALGPAPTEPPTPAVPPPAGAVRVGGNVRVPKKLVNAAPVYPATAQNAGVQGVVILELHIGTDGAVVNAQVLRSIPLLDQAAIDAVRQWRYEPTLLNGAAVPLIMTATVNFTLQKDVP